MASSSCTPIVGVGTCVEQLSNPDHACRRVEKDERSRSAERPESLAFTPHAIYTQKISVIAINTDIYTSPSGFRPSFDVDN